MEARNRRACPSPSPPQLRRQSGAGPPPDLHLVGAGLEERKNAERVRCTLPRSSGPRPAPDPRRNATGAQPDLRRNAQFHPFPVPLRRRTSSSLAGPPPDLRLTSKITPDRRAEAVFEDVYVQICC